MEYPPQQSLCCGRKQHGDTEDAVILLDRKCIPRMLLQHIDLDKLFSFIFIFGLSIKCPQLTSRNPTQFENVTLTPAVSIVPPVVPYNGLAFRGVFVVPNRDLSVVGFKTTNGNQYLASISLNQATLSTDYPGSNVASFSISSLFAGCYVNAQNGLAAAPVDCAIDFQGTTAKGAPVNQKVPFDYEPSVLGVSTVSQNLRKVKLEGFKDLKELRLVPSSDVAVLTGTVSDAFTYTVKYK